MSDAGAQPPATAPQDDAAKAAAQAAYKNRRAELQRRRDAEARLDAMLENPPDTAPLWMKRAHERNKAAAATTAAQGKGKSP